jgi:hypothetical protein
MLIHSIALSKTPARIYNLAPLAYSVAARDMFRLYV